MMITSQVRTFALYKDCSTQMGVAEHRSHKFGMNAQALKLAEEVHDLRLIPIHRPDEFAADNPFLIDDVCLRKFERSIESVAFLSGVARREQIHSVVFQKLMVSAVIVVDADR